MSLDTLPADVETAADYVLAHSYGGYTTNLPLEDVLDGQAWIAYRFDGEDLPAEHGGPARLLVPHLYFWKSAKCVRGVRLLVRNEPGVLGDGRLPRLRGPMARTALPGRLTWRVARLAGTRTETSTAETLVFDVPDCPACEEVVLRMVRTPDAAWLDMRGITALRIPLP